MRVLLVHGHYQIRGGEDEVFEAERGLLQAAGVEVDSHTDDNNRIAERGRLRTAADTIWSRSTHKAVVERLEARPADIVHVHNFFPLISPAVYAAARAGGAAVVQTLHNYRLICPNGLFYRDGRICEDCLGRSVPWPGLAHSCYRGSRAGSAAVVSMLATHRWLKTFETQVDRFIALTDFGRRKFIEGGLPADRIVVKPNFVADLGAGEGGGGFALFAGRLTEEKGIRVILDAWETLGATLPLRIMGTGPLEAEVAARAEAMAGVTFLGRQTLDAVHDAMGKALCFVLGSTWYEGFPRVISECYARGLPLIASAIGPIIDVVEDGQTGFLFRPGDAGDLVLKTERLLGLPADDQAALRQNARRTFETYYRAETNREQLLGIYRDAILQRTEGAALPAA
jgi:glycosyltransferase involved in cell wall biosynthesis